MQLLERQLIQKIELIFDNNKVAEVPIDLLAENAPVYDRKWKSTKLPPKLQLKKDNFKSLNLSDCLKKILSDPNISEKNGCGINMITQLWAILFKNQVVMLE